LKFFYPRETTCCTNGGEIWVIWHGLDLSTVDSHTPIGAGARRGPKNCKCEEISECKRLGGYFLHDSYEIFMICWQFHDLSNCKFDRTRSKGSKVMGSLT